MSTPAGGLVGEGHININANTAAAMLAIRGLTRDANGQLRDLRGRYVSESRLINGALTRAAGGGSAFSASLGKLKAAAIALSPALIPIAVQAAPIAASVGAASLAVGAFAAAAAGQVSAITEASDAEKKYQDAVSQHGAASKQAADAQAAYAQQMQQMPAATRTTAAAVSALKEDYQGWSDSLASSTMPVATKAIQTFGAVFPKLTPTVQGASTQLNRFVTIAAGSVASPGFDRLMNNFAAFSTGALRRANDALIGFMRTLDTGQVSGGVSQFMEYVRANGPLVRETIANVAQAMGNLLQGAANVGPGILTVVNALAGIAAAIPPGVITAALQLALALKAVRLAAVGMAAVSGGVAAFTASITAMQVAAAGATGVLPKVAAAIATLSRTAKIAVAGTGIGLVAIAISELSQIGDEAPPNVDKLTKSLASLGTTGKATGYAAKEFGTNFEKLRGQIDRVIDPSVVESVNNWGASVTNGWLDAGDDTEKFTASIGSIDTALADLVSGGQADRAAAAIKVMTEGMKPQQLEKFNGGLGDYKDALANLKFEQELTAKAMGLFGAQAQTTSAKLEAQKKSADGLRQAIQALSEQHRNAFDSETKFEAAIDAVTKGLQENGKTLDVTTDKGRANRDLLSQLAAATEDSAAKARENGASWQTVAGIYDRGRKSLVDNIVEMGKSRAEAERLAATLMTMPSPKMRLEMRTEDATRSLDSVIAAMKAAPGKKTVTVEALTSDAIALLKDLGLTVTKMPNGSFKVSAETQSAKDALAQVQRARDGLKSKTIDLSARDKASKIAKDIAAAIANIRSKTVTLTTVRHTLNVEATVSRNNAKYNGYASGGTPVKGETAIVGEEGPELVTFGSDARVFDAAATKKMLRGISGAGMDVTRGLAAGMGAGTAGVAAAAAAMASAVTLGVRQELQIASPSRVMKELAKDVGKGFISGLTASRDKIKAVSKDLAADVRAAFSGKKESALIGLITKDTNKLLSLASKRDALEKKILEANKFASDTTAQAKATGSLGSIVQDDAYSPKYVKGQMQASLNQIKKFTANVKLLQKKGLNKDLLRQILEMGPEQGAAFAASLAGADKATIKQYNSLNTQINKESGKLGKYGADLLYDSGKKAGDGFLTGLKGQQKAIEKLMLDIAKSMQKAIKKALGIKSPSRVMAAVGHMTMLGLEGGITRQLPAVADAMRKAATTVSSAAKTTLPAAVARRPAAAQVPALAVSARRAAGAGAGRTALPSGDIHVHVHVQLDNNGVIGSKIEMQNWLMSGINQLAGQGRLRRLVQTGGTFA